MTLKLPSLSQRVAFLLNDAEASRANISGDGSDEDLENLVNKIPKTNSNDRVFEIEFEKDDDTNFHIDFIVAASNLRAQNYEIQTADRHKVIIIYHSSI